TPGGGPGATGQVRVRAAEAAKVPNGGLRKEPGPALPPPGGPPAAGSPRSDGDSGDELRRAGQRDGAGTGYLARRVDDRIVRRRDAEDAHQRRRMIQAVADADVRRRARLGDGRGGVVPERPVAVLPARAEVPVRALRIRRARVRRVLEGLREGRVEAEAAEDAGLRPRGEGGLRLRPARQAEGDGQAADERGGGAR